MVDAGLIIVLFTDLVGSSDHASDLGDAAADELRRAHFAHLREALAATGGTEIKSIGDALMVTYNGAAGAISGAVAMQRAVARHNRQLEGRKLSMRVGVSAGDATFEDGDWFGTPVVEAARLCADADGGQILISELVRMLSGSRGEFEVRPLGERELKGLPVPLSVCEVVWDVARDETSVPLPAFVDMGVTFSFAGRSAERETLIAAWKEAAEGSRRIVLVSGEPGIGKTRLVSEVVRFAHDQGATVLWGRCDEELGVPYGPFAEALRQYVAAVPTERLAAELGPLGGELTRVLPELDARVPGLAPPVQTEAETERHRLFEAVSDLVVEISQAAPLVLVLDDVHWADKPSLLMLRHVARAAAPMRVLVLATYRDTDLDRTHPLSDVLADLRRQPDVARLALRGLDADGIAEFMASTAGHDLDERGHELARALHEETEGNPFFAGEVLRHLAETGAITQQDGRWVSDRTLEDVGIPEGIREVVGRRLSRLSETANQALGIGAVIGPEFDLATIEAAGGPGGDELFEALDDAARANIVREVPGTVGRYAFAHALVRSSLYEELTTNRRVRMHWRVGEALEARHTKDLDAHLGELGYHFAEGALAGDPLKAVEFARRAAEHANEELAFEEAVRHYERALGVCELVDDIDPVVQCDLQIGFANALDAAGDERRRAAVFAAADAARAIPDPDRLARSALILTRSGANSSAVLDPELVALLDEALEAIGTDVSALRARVMSALAAELAWGPEEERRRRLASESLSLARETRDPEALGMALSRGWSLIDGSAPFLEELGAMYREAEEVATAIDNPRLLASLLGGKGMVAACFGDLAALEAALEAQARIASGLRLPGMEWTARNGAAALAAFVGENDLAERLVFEGAELGRAADADETTVMGFIGAVLYQVRMAQGRSGELVEALSSMVGSAPDVPVWRVALAGALVESGQVDAAREHYEFLTVDDFAKVPRDIEFPVTMCGLARMTLQIQPPEPVVRAIVKRLAPFSGTFNWSGPTVTDPNDLGLAMASAVLGEVEESERYFDATVDLCERAGARAYLARAHLDRARARIERGDVAGARAPAETALGLGTDLDLSGPHGVIVRAQAILGLG